MWRRYGIIEVDEDQDVTDIDTCNSLFSDGLNSSVCIRKVKRVNKRKSFCFDLFLTARMCRRKLTAHYH